MRWRRRKKGALPCVVTAFDRLSLCVSPPSTLLFHCLRSAFLALPTRAEAGDVAVEELQVELEEQAERAGELGDRRVRATQ